MKREQSTSKESSKAIAERAGCSRTLVERLRGRGHTDDEIISRVQRRKAAEAAKREGLVNGHAADAIVTGGFPSYAESQRRKEAALAGLREAQLAKMVGDAVPRAQAKNWLAHILIPLAAGLRRIPSELRGELEHQPGEVVERLLGERIELTLQCAREFWHALKTRHGDGDGSLEIGGYLVTWTIERATKKA
jgi:hypothetical protein